MCLCVCTCLLHPPFMIQELNPGHQDCLHGTLPYEPFPWHNSEFLILLLTPPVCWVYRQAPQWLGLAILMIDLRPLCLFCMPSTNWATIWAPCLVIFLAFVFSFLSEKLPLLSINLSFSMQHRSHQDLRVISWLCFLLLAFLLTILLLITIASEK